MHTARTENQKCPLATQALHRLQRPFCDKLPVQTHIGLHKDNAWPHTARLKSEANGTTGSEIFSHPPHSPDFAPSEYQLFWTLKNHVAHWIQYWHDTKNCTFGVNTTTDLKNITTTSGNTDTLVTWNTPPLDAIIVGCSFYIFDLNRMGNFWIVPLLHSVGYMRCRHYEKDMAAPRGAATHYWKATPQLIVLVLLLLLLLIAIELSLGGSSPYTTLILMVFLGRREGDVTRYLQLLKVLRFSTFTFL
jgi:hypothetical protein